MMITFQVESWDRYFTDPAREGLWLEHYAELSPAHEDKMEMCPDVQVYDALARTGALFVVTARDQGTLVGYCLVVCRRHIHYAGALCAFEDSYFLTKSSRHGLVGYKLLRHALAEARRRGCVRAYFMTKCFASDETLLVRLGFARSDVVLSCWLGDK